MADIAAAYAALAIVACVFMICCALAYTVPRNRKVGIAIILFLVLFAVAHAALLTDAVIAMVQGRQ
jgi:hypothetical protein